MPQISPQTKHPEPNDTREKAPAIRGGIPRTYIAAEKTSMHTEEEIYPHSAEKANAAILFAGSFVILFTDKAITL